MHISDAQHEAYSVENVGFARAIEAGDSVEGGIPSGNCRSDGIGLEA